MDSYSRHGRELIGLSGLAWLREVRRPIASAVLDGQAVAEADDGSEGIQAVFEARNRPGSPMAFTAFDLLELDGQSVMGEAWTVRRKRPEDLLELPGLASASSPGQALERIGRSAIRSGGFEVRGVYAKAAHRDAPAKTLASGTALQPACGELPAVSFGTQRGPASRLLLTGPSPIPPPVERVEFGSNPERSRAQTVSLGPRASCASAARIPA